MRAYIMQKFKYELGRKSLETIFISFMRPILENGNVTLDNCTQQQNMKLKNYKQKLPEWLYAQQNLSLFSDEIGWETT